METELESELEPEPELGDWDDSFSCANGDDEVLGERGENGGGWKKTKPMQKRWQLQKAVMGWMRLVSHNL